MVGWDDGDGCNDGEDLGALDGLGFVEAPAVGATTGLALVVSTARSGAAVVEGTT